jgi:hypothetical protein
MSKGKKLSIWFSAEQLRRLELAVEYAQKNLTDRANVSLVLKELVGFPPEEGKRPVIDKISRRIIEAGVASLKEVKKAHDGP